MNAYINPAVSMDKATGYANLFSIFPATHQHKREYIITLRLIHRWQ